MDSASSSRMKTGVKRPRTDDKQFQQPLTELEIVPHPTPGSAAAPELNVQPDELYAVSVERLAYTVNPTFIDSLIARDEIGFLREPTQYLATIRFYELSPAVLRAAFANAMMPYIQMRMFETGLMPPTPATVLLNQMIPVVVDACMTAIYAKLRNIHKQYGTYAARFQSPPTYSKDISLPLPFADAIQNIGVFETECTLTRFLVVPLFPEGTQNEGRENVNWHSYTYEGYIPILEKLNIPMKNVEVRGKTGSAWWTYHSTYRRELYDLEMIFPPLHYSGHSALLASMFLIRNAALNDVARFFMKKEDDRSYGTRFQMIAEGFQGRAFAALCHAPNEAWNFDSMLP